MEKIERNSLKVYQAIFDVGKNLSCFHIPSLFRLFVYLNTLVISFCVEFKKKKSTQFF